MNAPPGGRYNNAMELPEGNALAGLKIVRYPDPVLSRPAAKIQQVDDGVRALARRMLEIMYANRGVGLAAPQVGVSASLFVANPAGEGDEQEQVYVNPQLVSREGSDVREEGCLSVPGVNCKIRRSAEVTIRATGLDGQEFVKQADGLLARIFQHELDHLDGMLIADRMSLVARIAHRRRLKELARDYEGEDG